MAGLGKSGRTGATRAAVYLLLALAPLSLSSAPPQFARQWPPPAKRHALIIGINDYSPDIGSMNAAVPDAKLMAEALVRHCAFPPRQIALFTSDQPAALKPTRSNILTRLSDYRKILPPDGLLLVFFAGHGIESNGKAYLLTSDSVYRRDDSRMLSSTALAVDELRGWIRDTSVSQVMLLLDACRDQPGQAVPLAGLLPGRLPALHDFTQTFDLSAPPLGPLAFATIYATGEGQRSYEDGSRHGYFTQALAEALSGRAADNAGNVTLAGTVRYLQEKVPARVAAGVPGGVQRPFLQAEGYDAEELVLAKRISQAAAFVRPPGATRQTTLGRFKVWTDPESWDVAPIGPSSVEFLSKSRNISARFLTAPLLLRTDTLPELLLALLRQSATEVHPGDPDWRDVNGRKVLHVRTTASLHGRPYLYHAYLYGDGSGSTALIAAAPQGVPHLRETEMIDFLNGLEIAPDPSHLLPDPNPKGPSVLAGGRFQVFYDHTRWQAFPHSGGRVIYIHTSGGAYAVASADPIVRPMGDLLQSVLAGLHNSDPAASLFSRDKRKIGAREFWELQFDISLLAIPFRLYDYIYSGATGTLWLNAYARRDLLPGYERDFADLANSVSIK